MYFLNRGMKAILNVEIIGVVRYAAKAEGCSFKFLTYFNQ